MNLNLQLIYKINNIRFNNNMKFNIFGKKKFKCNTCEKKFKTESELEQHRRQEHR